MDSQPASPATAPAAAPAPEVLQPRPAAVSTAPAAPAAAGAKRPLRRTYRPSHRASLIGLSVVALIVAINVAVIGLVLRKQSNDNSLASKSSVSISSAELNQLGINRSNIGTSNVKLTVAPDAQFKGKLTVDGSATISGTLNLNSPLTGTSANITSLQAGDTSLSKLNVNGDGTLNTLNLRKDLSVAGVTQLQGPVTLSQLLTVNNSVNILGNLAIGGNLSVSTFSGKNLVASSSLTVGGHIITSGPTPGVSAGGATGSNGTVAISGNDASGVISINIGAGAPSGTLANVVFHSAYTTVPQVVITPVGIGANFYVLNITRTGFSVGVASGLSPGGFLMNYIVEE